MDINLKIDKPEFMDNIEEMQSTIGLLRTLVSDTVFTVTNSYEKGTNEKAEASKVFKTNVESIQKMLSSLALSYRRCETLGNEVNAFIKREAASESSRKRKISESGGLDHQTLEAISLQNSTQVFSASRQTFPSGSNTPFSGLPFIRFTLNEIFTGVITFRKSLENESYVVDRIGIWGLEEKEAVVSTQSTGCSIWNQSEHMVFRRISLYAKNAVKYYFENDKDQHLKRLLNWLASYKGLFSEECKECKTLLLHESSDDLFMPCVLRHFETLQPYHSTCLQHFPLNPLSLSM
eukprot:TRINITY_DN3864_c0_g2_i3.p1 TRINITY_DN3864_c0_g2~~TRINITY_DN3864_c0_g2_i3.p1  ORF type:complete len:292 (+),score=37.11 TRINITY_DN3864_c0_g2_i3:341-1216(+)